MLTRLIVIDIVLLAMVRQAHEVSLYATYEFYQLQRQQLIKSLNYNY